MPETKNKERLIYNIQEFESVYLPKARKKSEVTAKNRINFFGTDLAKRIMKRIEIKL